MISHRLVSCEALRAVGARVAMMDQVFMLGREHEQIGAEFISVVDAQASHPRRRLSVLGYVMMAPFVTVRSMMVTPCE